jgi:hypothetical protein
MPISRLVLFLCLLLSVGVTNAQNPFGRVWAFGTFAGLEFTSVGPIVRHGFQLATLGGSSTLCDENGNLLVYGNGSRFFLRKYPVSIANRKLQFGMFDHLNDTLTNFTPNSRYYISWPNIQPCLIVPHPSIINSYYLFRISIDTLNRNSFLSYTIFKVNNGKILIDSNNLDIQLSKGALNNFKISGLSGCRHSNGKDFWIVTGTSDNDIDGSLIIPGNNNIISYCLSDSGMGSPVISILPPDSFLRNSRYDCFNLKLSYNGRKLVRTALATEIMDFDPSTGNAGPNFTSLFLTKNGEYLLKCDSINRFKTNTNFIDSIKGIDTLNGHYAPFAFGIAFSPNDSLLYLSNSFISNNPSGMFYAPGLFQFQIYAPNIQQSRYSLPQSQLVQDSDLLKYSFLNFDGGFGALQMGPDGYIYCALGGAPYLTRIKNPNGIGAACQ